MIILVTGVPGAGKTANTVAELLKVKDRPLFVDGIPELKIDHAPVPPLEAWTTYVPDPSSATGVKLTFTYPPNAIVVVDECQRLFRPRGAGQKVPDAVAAFETHRHTGIDFYLITQHPNLLDANIRRLANKHIHYRVTALGRYRYEWSECADPDSKASRAVAVSSRVKLPKKVFSQYKSAEVHTKIERRLPVVVWLLVLLVPIFLFLSWRIYSRVTDIAEGKESEAIKEYRESKGLVPTSFASGVLPVSAPYPPASVSAPVDLATDEAWNERRPGRPETAPAYAHLLQVQSMPMPHICAKMKGDCRCYTDQGTRLLQVTQSRCVEILEYGDFNPYKPPVSVVASPAGSRSQSEGQGASFVPDASPRFSEVSMPARSGLTGQNVR